MPTHPRPSFQLNMSLPTHRRASKLSISWNPKEVIVFDFFRFVLKFPCFQANFGNGRLGRAQFAQMGKCSLPETPPTPSTRCYGVAMLQSWHKPGCTSGQYISSILKVAIPMYAPMQWQCTNDGLWPTLVVPETTALPVDMHTSILWMPDCQLTWLAIFCKAYSCQLVDGPNLKAVKDLKAFKTLKGFHQVVLCLRSAKVEVSETF